VLALLVPVRPRLDRHLAAWLGQWPPTGELTVVTGSARVEPGWDGAVHPVVGVADPSGMVLSVPPDALAAARRLARGGGFEALRSGLGPLVGQPDRRIHAGVFRWSEEPADLADAGVWVPADQPGLPDWLRPFGGQALVASIGGRYTGGVGIKRHDPDGSELAVGTDEAFRGRGVARRLVAQAARAVIAGGAVPTYLHDPGNVASGRVAEAAGFPDRGWRVLGLW
jgi:GNAT superfamily N-acetyltransferase